MAEDMVASTIDDINWPQLSERLDLSHCCWFGAFNGLRFLASVFLELERFYDYFVSFF